MIDETLILLLYSYVYRELLKLFLSNFFHLFPIVQIDQPSSDYDTNTPKIGRYRPERLLA